MENVYIVYYIRIYILVKESGEFLHFLCLALICLHTEGNFFFLLTMLNSATNQDVRSREDRESTDNHEFVPRAAERLDDNVPREEITRRVTVLAMNAGLDNDMEIFKRGGWLAHDPVKFYTSDASEDEKQVLRTQ